MVTPIKKLSVSYEIIDRIMALFRAGELKPGDKLPSERELARRYAVSRVSVREAIKMLSTNQILESRPGSGTYVINTPYETGLEASSVDFVLDDFIMQSIEMRMIVEPKIARLAAEFVTEDELAKFNEIMDKMIICHQKDDFGGFSFLDMQFHYLCATASKNAVLYDTLQKYSGSSLHVTMIQQYPGALAIPCKHHEDLVAAFKSHDPDKAEKQMCQHIYHVFSKCVTGAYSDILLNRIRLLSCKNI